ncbi:MAG TPA: EAL domain-containing protein, partial [Kineosporiaceae bacterium]|nr:EAL domain-containing protein [Kineosporiaceae bacterium]
MRVVRTWLGRYLWNAVGRDRLTRAAADEDRQLQFCQYMWWVRHAAAVGGLVIGWRGGTGDRELAVIGALAVVQVAGHVWSLLRPGQAGIVSVADALVVMFLAALGLPSPVLLVVLVAIMGWAATFRPLPAVGSFLAVFASVVLMRQRSTALDPQVVLVAFCLLGGVFMLRTIRLNIGNRRAAEREQLVSERVDAVIWEEIPGRDAMKMSPAVQRLLGHPSQQWERPGFWREVVHPDDQAGLMPDPQSAAGGRRLLRLRHQDGTWRWMDSRTSSVTERSGRHAFFVGVLVDRTEQVEAEREALAFGRLVAMSPIGQLLLACEDGRPTVLALNPACQVALGLPAVASGAHWPCGADTPAVREVSALVACTVARGRASVEFLGADGRTYQADGHHVDDCHCKIDLIDVTERVRARERLDALARRDDLTGLPNRRALNELLARLTAPDGGPPSTALLILDLDRFKEINDSLGHVLGDELLRQVADRIGESVGATGVVARLGGDEFAVVLPGADDARAAELARRLAHTISRPIDVAGLRLRTRASIGIAVHPEDAATTDELIRRADVAMYQAKQQADEPQRYDAARDFSQGDRVTLISDLETAIDEGHLVLHHQPLFDLATGRLAGTEALVRWQHPTLGLIPPGEFIDLADAAGYMRALTRWVVRQALRDLRQLGDALGGPLEVSVNLSVRNLYELDFVDWLGRTLIEEGIDGGSLVTEITEHTVMTDYDLAAAMIGGLRELGVRTWIDDFGTGYSSLARLRNLPVHGVKIDRSFVTHAAQQSIDRRLLRNLIRLVDDLGLQTIAEGIEDARCLQLLRGLGCDLAQGYHLGRPAPLGTLLAGPTQLPAMSGTGAVPRPRRVAPSARSAA